MCARGETGKHARFGTVFLGGLWVRVPPGAFIYYKKCLGFVKCYLHFGHFTGEINMANNEKTSKDIASIASKGLKNPGSLTKPEIQALAASALTQTPDKPKPKGKK